MSEVSLQDCEDMREPASARIATVTGLRGVRSRGEIMNDDGLPFSVKVIIVVGCLVTPFTPTSVIFLSEIIQFVRLLMQFIPLR